MSVVEVKDTSYKLCIIHVEKILFLRQNENHDFDVAFTGEGNQKLTLNRSEAKKVYTALEKLNR